MIWVIWNLHCLISSFADTLLRLCHHHLGRSHPWRNFNASPCPSSHDLHPPLIQIFFKALRTRVSPWRNSGINWLSQGQRSSLRIPSALAPHGTPHAHMAFLMIPLSSSIRQRHLMSILSLQPDNWSNLGQIGGRIIKQFPSNQARQRQP